MLHPRAKLIQTLKWKRGHGEMKSPTSERGGGNRNTKGDEIADERATSERGGSKTTEYFHITFGQHYFRQKYLVNYIFVINIL